MNLDFATSRRADEVMVVGPGARFLSGIGYHTAALLNAFSRNGIQVSALLVRELCPRRLYPGRSRVGTHETGVLRLEDVPIHEGLDWYWGGSIFKAVKYLLGRRPEVLLLQWWTAVTAHSYILLASVGRLAGARVVLEMHETSDVGEAAIPGVPFYTRQAMRLLSKLSNGVVVHSQTDVELVQRTFPTLRRLPIAIVFPGPLQHTDRDFCESPQHEKPDSDRRNIRFLFFGVIRPYKGIDELAAAFSALVADGEMVHLTVAGEAWDEADSALATIRLTGEKHHRIISGYIPDEQVSQLFAEADVVVAPYRRASASGPINLAMEAGLPLVTTRVPALEEACGDYGGVVFANVQDPSALHDAMSESLALVGRSFGNPHGWDTKAAQYVQFFERIQHRTEMCAGGGSRP